VRLEEPSPAERTVARRAAEARATVPDLELAVEVEMDRCVALCAERGSSTTAALARACGVSLREHPRANGSYRDGHFELYSRVNVGIVVASEDTYLIPTVFDADRKPLDELSAEIEELADGGRAGRLSSQAFSGATFTLWDAGVHGIDNASIPVVPPQAAALSAGTIRQRPVVRDGELIASASITATLACDHRILYGTRAAQFLTAIKSRLEQAAL
jgi:pyruvate dehydrogenase E2 component (dihydrolipoamide acetyltransferase)